jgi:hypothetical protein
MTKDKCILVVGDDVVNSGTSEYLEFAYQECLQIYYDSSMKPSKKPSIWKCIKEPKQ